MKIIQSCGSLSWGGLEMVTFNLTKKLNSRGYDVLLLCRKDSKLHKEAVKNNIPALPMLRDNAFTLSSIIKLKNFLKSEKAFGVKVVHTHLSHDLWILVPALNLSKCRAKLFLTKHMGSGVVKKDIFHKYLYDRVDRVFAISNYIKKSVLDTCPIDNHKVTLLYDSISVYKFNKNKFDKSVLKKLYNIPENSIVIGMVGRMTPGKGHEDLIEAARSIREMSDNKIYFLIAGKASYGEDKYEEKIRTLVSESELSDRFIFTGFQSDVSKIMATIDILAFPSHLESFGLALLEAMAMELPVIASNNAGITDIVINGSTGLLVPPKNPRALAETILKLVDDPGLRTKYGTAGRKRAEEYFDLDAAIKQLEKYYNDK